MAFQKIFLDLQRDDLGVRRHLRSNQVPTGFQVFAETLIVVDIPVQDHIDKPEAFPIGGIMLYGPSERVIVDGMAVIFRNGTDRRPARMGQGRFKDHILSRKLLKDGIPGNGAPQLADIAAQIPDDRSGFIGKGKRGQGFMTLDGAIDQVFG